MILIPSKFCSRKWWLLIWKRWDPLPSLGYKNILNFVSHQEIHYHPQLMKRSYSETSKINSIVMGSGLKMLINGVSWTVGWGKIHNVPALPFSTVLKILYFKVTEPMHLAELCSIVCPENILAYICDLLDAFKFSRTKFYVCALLNSCFTPANPVVSIFHVSQFPVPKVTLFSWLSYQTWVWQE